MIFNQGNIPACAGAAFLGALSEMRPELDYETLFRELMADKYYRLTYQRAEKWFIKRGLIKGIKPCTYSPFLLRKQPILTGASGVNWMEVGKPPYMLSFIDNKPGVYMNSHYFFLPKLSTEKGQNAWGEDWGDKGCFYFLPAQVKRFKEMFVIVL